MTETEAVTAHAELLAAARNPTAAWLESCFGPGTLWRPEVLPEKLESERARAFLAEVGVPAVELDFAGYDSTSLPERGLWEADQDELYARDPEDDEPAGVAYCVGAFDEWHLMVDGECGVVQIYNSDGWTTGQGLGGWAADSLPEVIGALGLLASFGERITGGDAAAALDEFEALVGQLGQGPDRSDLWSSLLEQLREEYEELDEESDED
ncbi:SUKH-4 family immunity protein [Kitasatospora sp. NPDC094028]